MTPPNLGPVLSITVDAVARVQPDDLGGLWTVFTKCKESLEDGRRLENISWRLWYNHLTAHQHLDDTSSPILIHDAASPSSLPPVLSSESESGSDNDDNSDWDDTAVEDDVEHTPSQQPPPPPKTEEIPPIRLSSRSSARHTPPHRRLGNSHPDAASTSARAALESHRANSAPSRYRSLKNSSLNIGKIISTLLPDKFDTRPIRSASASTCSTAVLHPSTTYTQSTLTAPTVVILQPTPRPTPPESPSQSLHTLSTMTPAIKSPSAPMLTVPPIGSKSTHTPAATTSSGPGPPPAPLPVEDRNAAARKKFFFKESPGAGENLTDGGSSPSASSTSSEAKTQVPTAFVEEVHQEVLAAATAAAEQLANKITKPVKKGKEPVRPAARPPLTRAMTAHGHIRHVAGRAVGLAHQRNHSAVATVAKPVAPGLTGPVKSKSTAALHTLGGAAQVQQTQQLPPMPRRTTSQLKAQAPAPREPPVQPPVPVTALKPSHRGGRIALSTSSDGDSAPDEEGNSSSWASDFSDEERETGHMAREAATEAARQRDMFAKVPTPVNPVNTRRAQPSLLTNLMRPNPSIISNLPNALAYRAHNSAQNLGSRTPLPPPPSHLHTSKSSAAVPQAATVTVTQLAVNPSGRPGYRLKGRPEGLNVDDSSSDEDDEDDMIPVSKSIAQKKLEALAGMGRRKANSTAQVTKSSQAHVLMTSSDDTMAAAPLALPHPYNLPAPAPPATPRTTRREMLATEMSESLRRNILWERETNRRMLRGAIRPPAGMGILGGLRPLTSTQNSGMDQPRLGATKSGDEMDKSSPVRPLTRNYSSDNYHAAGW